MFQGLNLNTWPVWLVALFYISFTIYRDLLKPFFEKRLQNQLEIEKKNTEIKRYNEDMARWEKLFAYFEGCHKLDVLSINQAERLYKILIENSEKEFLVKLIDIIDANDIKNPERQKIIKEQLPTHLESEKNLTRRTVDNCTCNDLRLSQYFLSVDETHTQEFVNDILTILFGDATEQRKKTDLKAMLHTHYNNHINEATNWIKETPVTLKKSVK